MKFSELELHPKLQKNLDRINFSDCTPIQEQAIPHVLKGRDIAGLAQTGTGKTAAFLVPLIDRVLRGQDMAAQSPPVQAPADGEAVAAKVVQAPEPAVATAGGEPAEARPLSPLAVEGSGAVIDNGEVAAEEDLHLRHFVEWRRRNFVLILVPTRELAEQVYANAQGLLEDTGLKAVSVYGGTTYEKQQAAFKDGVEFVIATPGRLIDLYKEHVADLRQVRAIVFDEADRMFDMGFKDDMKFILKRIPRERQFLVFSATLNFEVLNTAYEFGAFPVDINISKDQPKAENVQDELFHVGQFDKPRYLLSLLKKHNPRQTIIFSNFKRNVERITRFLNDNGLPAVGISSLLTQAQRNRVMAQFKAENNRNILVATDLAARGLDVLGLDLVMNYELPDDPENYVHRIGRTGRAGHKGTAFSLVSDRDVDALGRIEEYLGHKIPIGWLEDAELVQEMKDFPPDFERSRDRGPGGGRGRDRDRDRGGSRGGGGRGPRREGRRPEGQGRRPEGARQEGQRFEGQRPEGQRFEGQRSEGQRSEFRKEGGGPSRRDGPRDQQGRGGEKHRDRRTGRHQHQGQSQSAKGENRSARPDQQQRDQHQRRDQQRGGRRPHQGGGRHSGSAQGARGSQGSRAPSRQPAAAMVAAPSLGQKVTGFFKKLLGGK